MILIALFMFVPTIYGQSEDPRIVKIREACGEANARIETAERNFAESDIFLTEMIVNSGGTMYPAVGNFKETIRFYYTYGNRELSPYPNRLLKITVLTERAATRDSAEYFFNQAGKLVFAFVNDGESQNRYYFAGGKLIGWQQGKQSFTRTRAPGEVEVREKIKRLAGVFNSFR